MSAAIRFAWRIAHGSVDHLARIAAVLALIGLGIMALSILWPRPLPVVMAMSVGHVIGALAVVCYLLAVVLEVSRNQAARAAPKEVAEVAEPPVSPPADA